MIAVYNRAIHSKEDSMFKTAILILAILLSGCATVPAPISVGPFADITTRMATSSDYSGERVRWGGKIALTTPEKGETCFQIVSHPLDSSARPEEGDQSDGRFIACIAGFFDPAVYAAGRELTVVGTLKGSEPGKIGGYDYNFPKLTAETVYLWPKREQIRYYPYYPDPFFYQPWPYRPWY
jgi:outer membrane lipoprotein